ncbi:hypothetical protein [uncultured Roseivirga sp.]|uniref:hypothetical protein n=1 Tax=uncultured Roseivirga sp. TaxID=543088 RepID=UPI0030DAE016
MQLFAIKMYAVLKDIRENAIDLKGDRFSLNRVAMADELNRKKLKTFKDCNWTVGAIDALYKEIEELKEAGYGPLLGRNIKPANKSSAQSASTPIIK